MNIVFKLYYLFPIPNLIIKHVPPVSVYTYFGFKLVSFLFRTAYTTSWSSRPTTSAYAAMIHNK